MVFIIARVGFLAPSVFWTFGQPFFGGCVAAVGYDRGPINNQHGLKSFR